MDLHLAGMGGAAVGLQREVPKWLQAIIAICAVFMAGWGASEMLGEQRGLPGRVDALEARVAFTDSAVEAVRDTAAANRDELREIRDLLDSIGLVQACDYWNVPPERCPAAPPRPPTARR